MNKPPCKTDGILCPRRRVGCRDTCPDWTAWLAQHEAERANIRRQKDAQNDVESFISTQGERTRLDSARRAAKERREGLR